MTGNRVRRRQLIAFLVVCVAVASCAKFGGSRSAPLKVITIPCQVPATAYAVRTRELLSKTGFTVVPEPTNPDEIEASRPAVYTGAGEGLQMNGPYRWVSRYAGGAVAITVQTVHVNPDGSVYPSASHDENAPPSDRRHFAAVIDGLRQLCRGT